GVSLVTWGRLSTIAAPRALLEARPNLFSSDSPGTRSLLAHGAECLQPLLAELLWRELSRRVVCARRPECVVGVALLLRLPLAVEELGRVEGAVLLSLRRAPLLVLALPAHLSRATRIELERAHRRQRARLPVQ